MPFLPRAAHALVLLAAACSSQEAKEARAVITAIDALRNAPADDLPKRRTLVEALAKTPATADRARAARDACASAYRPLIEGKEAIANLKRALDGSGGAPSRALSSLTLAEEKIRQSEQAMPACEKAAAELGLRQR